MISHRSLTAHYLPHRGVPILITPSLLNYIVATLIVSEVLGLGLLH
jgi:hypothetical protein